MNIDRSSPPGMDHYRSLQILDELSNDDSLTQRDLSGRLGIALGLVNSYIKNLVAKGFITVKSIPPKRYTYYLTPKGFAEKSRLAYHLLQDYTRIYREAKNNFRTLFREMESRDVRRVVFAGADEVAEIAYLMLQETAIKLIAIVDPERSGDLFFGRKIGGLDSLPQLKYDGIIVTSYVNRDRIQQALLRQGADRKTIRTIF